MSGTQGRLCVVQNGTGDEWAGTEQRAAFAFELATVIITVPLSSGQLKQSILRKGPEGKNTLTKEVIHTYVGKVRFSINLL